MSDYKNTKPIKRERIRRDREVRYPLIETASKHTDDSYWRSVISDIARNKCPKKVMVDSTKIQIHAKRNIYVINYNDYSPELLVEEIKNNLKKLLNMYSELDIDQDQANINEQFAGFLNVTELNDWKKIKSKKLKEDLLVHYVIQLKKEFNMSWSIANKSLKILDDAIFNIRTHRSDDIEMRNGKLLNINDIGISSDGIINLRLEDFEEVLSEERYKTLTNRWESHLKSMFDF